MSIKGHRIYRVSARVTRKHPRPTGASSWPRVWGWPGAWAVGRAGFVRRATVPGLQRATDRPGRALLVCSQFGPASLLQEASQAKCTRACHYLHVLADPTQPAIGHAIGSARMARRRTLCCAPTTVNRAGDGTRHGATH